LTVSVSNLFPSSVAATVKINLMPISFNKD